MRHLDRAFEVKDITETGTFAGYGSVYGVVDQGDDVVEHGAFADSLAEHAAKGQAPALLWQHRSAEPIGRYTKMVEDANGLYVEGALAMKTQRGAEAHELLKMKAISGMSIGFMTREDSYDQKTGIRTIKKGDLWECSLVTFPMNDAARVSMVKSIEQIEDLGGIEAYLREASGLTRSEAKAVTSRLITLARREVARQNAEEKVIVAAILRRPDLRAS